MAVSRILERRLSARGLVALNAWVKPDDVILELERRKLARLDWRVTPQKEGARRSDPPRSIMAR